MGLSRMSRARLSVIAVCAAVVVASVLLAGILVGDRVFSPMQDVAADSQAHMNEASPAPVEAASPSLGGSLPDSDASSLDIEEDFIEFHDEEAGFRIRHPVGWLRRQTEDPQVRLLAAPDERDSVMVRVTPLDLDDEIGEEVTDEDIAALHGFTRQIVEDDGVEVLLGPEIVELAGQPASYYLYLFEDDRGDQRGAHAHYFLFERDRMISLVLQVVPAERFSGLADVFDVVATSFELDP